MVTVPLRRWHREPIGVLNVLNKRNGTLADSDLGLLTIIAAFAALAIQQARQFEDTKKAEVITLLGDIGLDMENLLTPVQAGIDLLKDVTKDVFTAMETSGSGRQKLYDQAFQIAQNGIRRLHDRVKEIADCVKGLSAPPVFAPCRLDVVVQEVFQTLRGLAADKRIALLGNGLTSLPAIYADERRLYNAFYNLINNAIPETPDGGAITVRGCLDSGGRAVVVAVQDTGRGMPSEIRDRLFSVRAVSTKKSGTGLGTKIVKDVVDAHKGTIRVDSEPGRGTTFHLRLPLDPRSASC
jgi:signal transduction histidine kinase